MVLNKKLLIGRFETALETEKFYANFATEHKIKDADVKIVSISKFKPTYLLVLQYLDKD